MSSPPPPTQKDLDCIFLARDALFPLKIQRDGSHPTQFPASEAIGKVRDAAMEHDANRAASSFFPRGIVLVRDVNNQTLQWNGQPDISNATASVPVIPKLLSVRCCECGDGREAYVTRKNNNDTTEREIVLCSDKLLKGDYTPAKKRKRCKVKPVFSNFFFLFSLLLLSSKQQL